MQSQVLQLVRSTLDCDFSDCCFTDSFHCSNKVTPQEIVKAVIEKLDKFEKQKLQDIKVQGSPHPIAGMLFSITKIEPLEQSFKETKKQLEKLTKLLK
jgi:hypothetical protein